MDDVEQGEGACNLSLNEILKPVYVTVDMAFSGEVQLHGGRIYGEQSINQGVDVRKYDEHYPILC